MNRRRFIRQASGIGTSVLLAQTSIDKWKPMVMERAIPSSGERIPIVGMGSWLTFDVGQSVSGRKNMSQVLQTFVDYGGRVIDSSPMYGSSENVIGDLAGSLGIEDKLWYATKVWTNGKENGKRQIDRSQKFFQQRIQLHQIHNLRDLSVHYDTLVQLKNEGRLPYIGVTHYINGMHESMIDAIKQYPVDFLQINYNIENPSAENRLLPTAADLGVAVIINRPFQTGRLFRLTANMQVPDWVRERGVDSWATYYLKYILSNPQVTCAIPATTQVSHVIENLRAGARWLPDPKERTRMLKDYQSMI